MKGTKEKNYYDTSGYLPTLVPVVTTMRSKPFHTVLHEALPPVWLEAVRLVETLHVKLIGLPIFTKNVDQIP